MSFFLLETHITTYAKAFPLKLQSCDPQKAVCYTFSYTLYIYMGKIYIYLKSAVENFMLLSATSEEYE